MINFDFTSAIAFYILTVIGAGLVSWLIGRRQKDKELSLDSRFIWFCSVCSYTYVNTREDLFSVCPRCGSYNKKVDTKESSL